MVVTIASIKIAMRQILDNLYPNIDRLLVGKFSADDVIDQAVMEYIVKDYQLTAERQSLRQHRAGHGMTTQIDDSRTAQLYFRLVDKAKHYKDINANQLLQSTGVQKIDLTTNEMTGSSNWQNAYALTDVEFHELTVQHECKLLPKIFEHKISSQNSVPNPKFKVLFSEYEAMISELYQSVDLESPETVIGKTAELFVLQWKYCIDLFYQITMEAEQHGFPDLPYKRIAAFCCTVPVLPATNKLPIEIHAADCRMLMRRDAYIKDIFELSDDEWMTQMDVMGDAYRLKEVLCQAKKGTAFIPAIQDVPLAEKAEFIHDRFWIWDKCQHFDFGNRKRIKCMRDLFENLTVKMPPYQNS